MSMGSQSKTLYIIRHGETEMNRLGIIQGGSVDSSLNETGHQQAWAFYRKYQQVPFEKVITSTLKRTHQTVAPFVERGIKWEQVADINEMNWGSLEGKPSTPEVYAEFLNVVSKWQSGDLNAGFYDGESAMDLSQRLRKFIDSLHHRPENHLLVCTHGRAMRALMCLIKGQSLTSMEGFKHANTGLYKIQLQADGRFDFEMENDTTHLQENVLLSSQNQAGK
jgi:probable phosphoglycerate mutase